MSQPKGSQPSTPLTGHAAELFDNLTLGDEKPKVTTERRPSLNTESTSRPRGPPPPRPAAHKPSRSQEEDPRARKPSSGNRPRPAKEDVLDIFADPDEKPKKHEARRPRRNSESSVMERKPLDTEEERKRHERKRRERKEREMREKGPKKPNRKLDVIDKLDLSSIYGTGLFHHDGPFDACNPHRNRQGSKRAPMQAFPEGSLNNSLSGGPIEKRADHSTFMGRADDEAYNDYGVAIDKSRTGKEPTVINSTSRVEPIHGDESLGLGTSTFLEGAPASRTAIKQLESERQEQLANGGGLSRKKSLAQKIRGVGPRRGEYGGRMNGHEGAYSPTSPPLPTNSSSRSNGDNPFDFDFGNEGRDRKFGSVSNESGRPKGADVRERLERRATDDVLSYGDKENGSRPAPPPPPGGGFLSRVKSLKGGPRKPSRSIPQPES
ncbi:Pal1 cell morphology protein-domain-containing protein [Xylogone sp. PMI_703]|nr:Pal1 cell morphology protein-domain-containing protein [Xylogone sp. PMI_703]